MANYNYVVLPIVNDGSPSFIERLDIDGIFYDFKFDWNERDTCWLMTILNPNEDVIIGNVKLVLDFELIAQHKVEGMPSGSLALLDLTNSLEVCGFDDLGNTCQLIYTTRIS